jgi:transcriptional regulator with XRE-family HTH domain
MTNNLVDWLAEELQVRGWSYRELARRAGVSHTTVSNVLAGRQAPTWDFCAAVAEAVGMAPPAAFVMAGLLPPPLPAVEEEEEALALLRELSPDGRAAALAMLRGLAGMVGALPDVRIIGDAAGAEGHEVPVEQLRSLAERVARLSPEAQERVMEAFLQLVDTVAA